MAQLPDSEWDLSEFAGKSARRLTLSVNELCLLDWAICAASRLIPEASLGELVQGWGPLREMVWHYLTGVDLSAPVSRPSSGCGSQPPSSPTWRDEPRFDMSQLDQSDAKALLAILPTTHHWGGGGIDCGFELKRKLYKFATGDYPRKEEGDESKDPGTSENKAPG